jgi:hypothetical protein
VTVQNLFGKIIRKESEPLHMLYIIVRIKRWHLLATRDL